jgi:hypothetical protein
MVSSDANNNMGSTEDHPTSTSHITTLHALSTQFRDSDVEEAENFARSDETFKEVISTSSWPQFQL